MLNVCSIILSKLRLVLNNRINNNNIIVLITYTNLYYLAPESAVDIDRINPSPSSTTNDPTTKMNGVAPPKTINPSYPTVTTTSSSSSSPSYRNSTAVSPDPSNDPSSDNTNITNNNNNNNNNNSDNNTNHKDANGNNNTDESDSTKDKERDGPTRPRAGTADLFRGVIVQPTEPDDELPPPFYTSEVVTNTCVCAPSLFPLFYSFGLLFVVLFNFLSY